MIDPLNIPKTDYSPFVYCDGYRLRIEGESRPENAEQFYSALAQKLEEFINQERGSHSFSVEFIFDYISSSSLFFLKQIIVTLKNSSVADKIKYQWYYNEKDLDIRDTGELLSSVISTPFEFIELS